MTAAAGIPINSATPQAGAASKVRSRTNDESGSSGRSGFAEMFSYFENEASQGTLPTPPDIGANSSEGEDGAPLEAEATHNAWFGGETKGQKGQPQTEADRRASMFVLKGTSSAGQQEATADPLPPFGMSEPTASDEVPVADENPLDGGEATTEEDAALAVQGESINPQTEHPAMENALPDESTDGHYPVQLPPESAATPLWETTTAPAGAAQTPAAQIAGQLATASAYAGQGRGARPASADQSSSSAGRGLAEDMAVRSTQTVDRAPASGNAAPSANTGAQPSDAASMKVQASLSALESVLSRETQVSASSKQGATHDAAGAPKVLRDAGITSVRQETYFAPGGWSQSPALQIAQRVTHEMQQFSSQAAAQSGDTAQAAKSPVRVLHIQLDPPELGPLTVRMSMQNDALRLQLETSNQQTASLIQNDKEALTRLLRSAGYSLDGLNIQVTQPERGAGAQALGQGDNPAQSSGQQQGWRQSDGRGAGQSWQGQPQDQSQGGAQHRGGRDPQGRPRRSDYYL